MISVDQVRQALDARGLLSAYAWGRSQFMARCPCHEDGIASLSVGANDRGQVLVYCHAGCTADGWEPVLRALDLWDDSLQQCSLQQVQQGRGGRRSASSPTFTAVVTTAVVGNARDLAAARGRTGVSRIEAQRWYELLEHMQGLLAPVPVDVRVPRHAGPVLYRLAESLRLFLGLRAAGIKGYAVSAPFTFARSNPQDPAAECGFGEAWSLLSSDQVGNGLSALKRFGSIERVPPPTGTDRGLLDPGRRGGRTPPNFWRIVVDEEGDR